MPLILFGHSWGTIIAAWRSNAGTGTDLKAIGDGMNASGAALIGASVAADLPTIATSFTIPYCVIQGRYDLFSPTFLVEEYFKKVRAPTKRLIIIEDAGHFALATRLPLQTYFRQRSGS